MAGLILTKELEPLRELADSIWSVDFSHASHFFTPAGGFGAFGINELDALATQFVGKIGTILRGRPRARRGAAER